MTDPTSVGQRLTDEQLVSWRCDGFIAIPMLVAGDDLAQLREAYDEVLADGSAPGDRQLGAITRQVMGPSRAHPVFADNAALRAAREVGAQLLGGPVSHFYDMLIDKPPGHPHETPWHQDLAYSIRPVAPAGTRPATPSAQFWIPLDDVDEENGCMSFAAGYQDDPLLPHEVASGDPADDERLLALVDPDVLDPARTVTIPLAAGGATVHAPATPHFTGANRSTTRPRRAYIFTLLPEGAA
jgi:ectoine hydroxylase-related dioxygenase (phytanoyl-CoA dioxygenase family)